MKRTDCAICHMSFNQVRPQTRDSRGHLRGWCVDCQRAKNAQHQRDKYARYLATLPVWALIAGASRRRSSTPRRGRDVSERGEILREERREAYYENMVPHSEYAERYAY